MKIRPLKRVNVSADDKGKTTRYLVSGEVYESAADWEHDLFARLVDAGLAAEADKVIEIVPETKAPPKQRRRK